ncbi:MAG: MFS transporter [Chloroflexota bacterium]|nr:MFS transporter [Chloroflexota bacterium]
MAASTAPRRSLFRHPNYLKLWSAATLSLFGTQLSQIAIPFIAAVVLQASPGEVGLLTTVEFLPFLLFTLPAGVWVDRFSKKRILVIGDLGRALMLLSIPVAAVLGGLTMVQLYIVGFGIGVMTVFFDVADQSYLPTILERDELVEGNSKLQISQSSAQILGQPLGGGIIALVGAPVAILVDAISYIGSAGLILWIRETGRRLRRPIGAAASGGSAGGPAGGSATAAATEAEESTASPMAGASVSAEARAADADALAADAEATGPRPGMRSQIADGLRFIFGHEYLGNIAATTATSNLFGNIGFAIFPVFVYRELQMSPAAVGAMGGLGGAGVLIGALIASRVQARFGVGRTIILTSALFGPVNLLIPLATPDVALLFLSASIFFASVNNVIYNVSQVSLRQAVTPEHFLGRMNATMRFLVWGTIPIGSLIGAGLSEVVGVRTTIWISAILGLFAFLPVFLSKVRTIQTIPTEDPDEVAAR